MAGSLGQFSVRHRPCRRCNSTAHCTALTALAELHQYAVACHLEDATPMLGDQRLQHISPTAFQHRERSGLVSFY